MSPYVYKRQSEDAAEDASLRHAAGKPYGASEASPQRSVLPRQPPQRKKMFFRETRDVNSEA